MRWRSVVAGLLVFFGCVTVLAAVPLRWADQQLWTDSYAETIRPLVRQPAVQAGVSDRIVEAVGQSGRDLPPQAEGLIESQVATYMSTPAAAEMWVTANVAARDSVLRGTGSEVTLDVAQLVDQLRGQLREQGVPVPRELPTPYTRVVLVDSPAVGQARESLDLVSVLATVLPVLGIGLLALALIVSPRRGHTLAAAGFGCGIPTLLLVLLLPLAEDLAAASVGDERTRPFVRALYQAFAESLRADLLWLLAASAGAVVVGVVLAVLTRRRGAHAGPPPPLPDSYYNDPPPDSRRYS